MYIIFILIYQFTAKTFTEFIPNYYKDNNTLLQNNNLIQKQLNDETTKIENETKNNEINKLKEKLTEEKNKNNILNKKIEDLNNIIKKLKQENIDIKKDNNDLKEKLKILEKEKNKDINLIFKTMENQQYNLKVPKDIQFMVAIQKLYNNYPLLETKKIGTLQR